MTKISEADLILNQDGSIYHLHLLPGDLATTIITVGDPDRVEHVSRYFDSIELKKQKREFVTHTGYLNNKRLSVISTGISTDNIDIVFNEIDALFNIDFATRQVKDPLTSLNIIRLGTAGGLQADIPLDSVLITQYAVGFDGLLPFYTQPVSEDEAALLAAIKADFAEHIPALFYAARGSQTLEAKFASQFASGINATCGGFYAPQGRNLRLTGKTPDLAQRLSRFTFQDKRITHFEMETAAIYGLGRALGHECCSLNAILVNRINQKFSKDPMKAIDKLIQLALEVL